MNKTKSLTLYISFLPILILVLLIVGAGYLLTQEDINFLGASNKIKARSIEGFPATILTSNILDKTRRVIKTQEDFDKFLADVDSSGQLKVKDKINFKREWVVATTSKTLKTDGYKLKIRKIYDEKEDNKLLVNILLTEPGKECEVETATNVVMDLVVIKHTDKEIDFERFKNTKECN